MEGDDKWRLIDEWFEVNEIKIGYPEFIADEIKMKSEQAREKIYNIKQKLDLRIVEARRHKNSS